MAEPTDINKNKSAVDILMDTLRVELKELQKYKTVNPEVLGGKSGKSVPVPKKFTAEQTIAFMKLFPNAFPLADENAYFGIARALTTESPELFDVASFDAYEEKFGKIMEMQETGASASKNITTAKAPKAANVAKDPTQITLREAADAYNARGAGTIARFGAKGTLKQYGDMPLVQAFTPDENGVRPVDTMLKGAKSQGAANSLQDDLRRIAKDVNRQIFNVDPDSPALNILPGLEADDPQTFRIFGERVSSPKQTEIAIIAQNKQGWGEFMQQLNAIREGGGNDAVIADSIYVTLQTGYRSGAVAGLTGAEYKVDRGTIEITPQTKATPELEKRKGAQKVGGKRGQAIPQDVPLNEQSHSRLQQRLAANQQDVGIRSFIENKIKAGKAAPVFVITGKDGKYRQVNTTDMTEVLSRIKTSTPIMKDNVNNKEFNTLVPDDPEYTGKDKKGKFGAALLRNVFANVAAFEVQMSDTMLDFLQGRSQKSGAETRSKTAKSGYLVRPRGTFYPAERDAAQSVGNWFDEVEGVSVVDRFDPTTQTISKTSYGIPGMFDQPAPSAPPAAAQPIPTEKPAPASLDDLSPETKSAMEKAGFKFRSAAVAGLAALKVVPGPLADLASAVGEKALLEEGQPDPYDVAAQKGAEFAREKGLPESLGSLGAVVIESATGAVSREKQDMKIPSMMQEAQDRQYDFGDEFGNIPDDEQGFVPKREKEADPRITI